MLLNLLYLSVMKRGSKIITSKKGFSLVEVSISLVLITTLSIVISRSFTTAITITERTRDLLQLNAYTTAKLAEFTNREWDDIPESTPKLNPDGSIATDADGKTIYEKPTECINPSEIASEFGPPLNPDGSPHNTPDVACQVEVWVAESDGVIKVVNVKIFHSILGKADVFEYTTILNKNSTSNRE